MGIHVLIENVFLFLHMFVYGMPGTFSRGDMNWAATGRSQMMMKQKNMSLRLGRVCAASACVLLVRGLRFWLMKLEICRPCLHSTCSLFPWKFVWLVLRRLQRKFLISWDWTHLILNLRCAWFFCVLSTLSWHCRDYTRSFFRCACCWFRPCLAVGVLTAGANLRPGSKTACICISAFFLVFLRLSR